MTEPAAPALSESPGADTLLETLIATAADGIMVIDDRGTVQVYNGACERLFHYRPDEVVGQNVKMLMPSPYREGHDQYLDHYKKTGDARIIGIGREVSGQRKDGSTFPLYLSVGAGMWHGKRIFVGIVHDLSVLKREQAAREEQTNLLVSIVESSNDAIISRTLDGIVTSMNSAAEAMFGYTKAELIGRPISILFPPGKLAEEKAFLTTLREGQTVEHYETTRLRKDRTQIDVSLTVSLIYDAAGNIIGASKTVRDITERKLAEARLRTLQGELSHIARLTEMGQLSAALAHELNQPLTAILNYMNVAKRLLASTDVPTVAKANDAIAKAGQQALRAGQIIRRLRDFVEKRDTKRTIEDINKVAEDAIALGLLGHASANIKVRAEFAHDLPPIMADKVQIQQVIINLLRNAAEAMANSPRRELTISTAGIDDSGVEITVADTGPGIPEAVAARLFEPFVTSKPNGMGIGLAISYSIVEAHGGRLRMTPNKGGGTVFRFHLPAAQTME